MMKEYQQKNKKPLQVVLLKHLGHLLQAVVLKQLENLNLLRAVALKHLGHLLQAVVLKQLENLNLLRAVALRHLGNPLTTMTTTTNLNPGRRGCTAPWVESLQLDNRLNLSVGRN